MGEIALGIFDHDVIHRGGGCGGPVGLNDLDTLLLNPEVHLGFEISRPIVRWLDGVLDRRASFLSGIR